MTATKDPACPECGGQGIINGRPDVRDGWHVTGDPCPRCSAHASTTTRTVDERVAAGELDWADYIDEFGPG